MPIFSVSKEAESQSDFVCVCVCQSAVGLFQSEVKTHLLLLADRGRADSDPLQQRFRDLAPKYTGKVVNKC